MISICRRNRLMELPGLFGIAAIVVASVAYMHPLKARANPSESVASPRKHVNLPKVAAYIADRSVKLHVSRARRHKQEKSGMLPQAEIKYGTQIERSVGLLRIALNLGYGFRTGENKPTVIEGILKTIEAQVGTHTGLCLAVAFKKALANHRSAPEKSEQVAFDLLTKIASKNAERLLSKIPKAIEQGRRHIENAESAEGSVAKQEWRKLHDLGREIRDTTLSVLDLSRLIRDSDTSKIADSGRISHEASVAGIGGTLAHELRNAFGSWVTWGELLREGGYSDTTPLKAIFTTLEQLLAKKSTNPKPEKIDSIRSIIDERLHAIFSGTPHAVDLTFPDDRGQTITVDLHALTQVVVNLGTNAKHAMTAANTQQGCFSVAVSPRTIGDKSGYVVTLADNGPGIPKDLRLEDLFDPMQVTTTKRSGNGLGLPICKAIADAHDGSFGLKVESSSAGTVFSFFLPDKK